MDREELFSKLRGFVTYGCPLDKFAFLWPSIVPINKQNAVFSNKFEWINIYDHTDPVADRLRWFSSAFGDKKGPKNLAYKSHWALFVQSH